MAAVNKPIFCVPTSFDLLSWTLRSPFHLSLPKAFPESFKVEMPSFQPDDLESGAAGTGIVGTRLPSSEPPSQQGESLGTKAMANSRPQPNAQSRTPDRPKNADMFIEDAGQSLLLAFDSYKNKGSSAILVPVFRPSVEWARNMESIESEKRDPLPVKAPKKAMSYVERWRQFRWLHRGEDEVEIWGRIKQQYLAQQPRWYPFVPFWRPVLIEERNAGTSPHDRNS